MVVELPGVQDQQRAYDIVKEAAYLQMQIVDKSQAVGQSIADIDAILESQRAGRHRSRNADADSQQRGRAVALHECHRRLRQDCRRHHEVAVGRVPGTSRRGRHDSAARKAAADSARDSTKRIPRSTTPVRSPHLTVGPFSQLIQQGRHARRVLRREE